jgi:large subunit ribosomal protein L25
MEPTIECQKRAPGSKPKALRREGRIPASLYGHNGAESVELTVSANEMATLMRNVGGKGIKVQLNVPDMPWNGVAVIQEVQTHPWKGFLYHLSFYAGSKIQ